MYKYKSISSSYQFHSMYFFQTSFIIYRILRQFILNHYRSIKTDADKDIYDIVIIDILLSLGNHLYTLFQRAIHYHDKWCCKWHTCLMMTHYENSRCVILYHHYLEGIGCCVFFVLDGRSKHSNISHQMQFNNYRCLTKMKYDWFVELLSSLLVWLGFIRGFVLWRWPCLSGLYSYVIIHI
jgi:hypothetical protein